MVSLAVTAELVSYLVLLQQGSPDLALLYQFAHGDGLHLVLPPPPAEDCRHRPRRQNDQGNSANDSDRGAGASRMKLQSQIEIED